MSETVNHIVEFKCKYGTGYRLLWSPTQKLWKIFMLDEDDTVLIARFKELSKAVKFCELLKESE